MDPPLNDLQEKWEDTHPNQKFNLGQLDGMVHLRKLSNLCGQEEDKEVFWNSPALSCFYPENPIKINKLFEGEELFLGENLTQALDSKTLPMLFRSENQRSQKKPKKIHEPLFNSNYEKALQRLLYEQDMLPQLATYICQVSGLPTDHSISLPYYSPLAPFVTPTQGSPATCSLTFLLTEVLRYTFQNLHDAIFPEKEEMIPEEPEKDTDENCAQSMILSEYESIATNKNKHRQWDQEEEMELRKIVESTKSLKEIPHQVWKELSIKLGRTIGSIHAKAKTLTKKEKMTDGNLEENREGYYEMITSILESTENKKATKKDIIKNICEKSNKEYSEIEKGVVQCLSKRFERCPGVYRLRENVIIPSKEDARYSVKSRLIFILGNLIPSRESTLSQIRQLYQKEFSDELDTKTSTEGNQAVWEKTISKTLLKSPEIDKSCSKTQYTFKRNISL